MPWTRLQWEEELMGFHVGEASIICEVEGFVLRVVKEDNIELTINPVTEPVVNVELDRNIVIGVESVG